MSKRAKPEDLSCACVDARPVSVDDWGAIEFDSVEAFRCEKCRAVVTSGECDCGGYVPSGEGPMMNYYYPIPGLDLDEAARVLVDLPFCVVEVDGETGIALTGGGMDLSWEICEAHMLLGCLPPLHFADLPGMSGRGLTARDRWIVSGVLRSCSVAEGWAKNRGERVRAMVRRARKEAAERGAR